MNSSSSRDNARNAATFAAGSAQYASARPTYPDALFDWLAAQAPARDAAWDVGCGNGQATRKLAQRFARVLATDVSAEQIAQAPALANVEWRAGRAEEVDFAPGAFDCVLAAQALHWFDLDRFYPRVAQALAPGGVFAAVGYSWFVVDPDARGAARRTPLDEAIRRTILDPLRPFWAQGNQTLWRGYEHIAFPFEPIVAPALAIDVAWTADQMLAYVDTWSAVKRMRGEAGVDVIAAARAEIAPLWGGATRRVSMPLTLRAGRRPSG